MLCKPPAPVSEIDGKYADRATPTCAFAAMMSCSAAWTLGTTLEQRRWQSGRYVRRVRLIHEREPPRDGRRQIPEQQAERVLLLRDSAIELNDRGLCTEHELLCLAHVEQRRGAAGLAHSCQRERFVPRFQRPLRNFHLQIQGTQFEVRVCDVRNHRTRDRTSSPLRRKQLGAGGFGRAAIAAPEIEGPVHGSADAKGASCLGWRSPNSCHASAARRCADADRRILIRPCFPQYGASLEHTSGCDLQVVVLCQRGVQQGLQLLVFENVPPVRIGKRRPGGCGLGAAVRLGHGRGGLDVLRTDDARRR